MLPSDDVIDCHNCGYLMTEAEAYAAPMAFVDPADGDFWFWCVNCRHLAAEQVPRRWKPTVIAGGAQGPSQRPLDLVGLTVVPDTPQRSAARHPSNRRRTP